MSSLASYEFSGPIFEKEDLIEGFKVICFVINNFFLSFEISGEPYTLSQNTTREIGHWTMCLLNFMILLKCPHFLGRLTTREVPCTLSL